MWSAFSLSLFSDLFSYDCIEKSRNSLKHLKRIKGILADRSPIDSGLFFISLSHLVCFLFLCFLLPFSDASSKHRSEHAIVAPLASNLEREKQCCAWELNIYHHHRTSWRSCTAPGTANGLCVQVQPGDVQGFYEALWSCCVSGTSYTCCAITNRTGERYMNNLFLYSSHCELLQPHYRHRYAFCDYWLCELAVRVPVRECIQFHAWKCNWWCWCWYALYCWR